QFWRADQGRTAPLSRNFFCRTAHVDIQAIKAQLTNDVRDLVEHFRCVAIDLRNHRSLDLGIHEVSDQSARCMKCGFYVYKFRKRNIRIAVLSSDEPERSIGDSVHGREADDGFVYFLPEIHMNYPLR